MPAALPSCLHMLNCWKASVNDQASGDTLARFSGSVHLRRARLIPRPATDGQAGAQGVACVGYTDLPSRLPAQSSTLYSNNISKFLLSMGPFTGHKGTFLLDHNDPAVRGALVLDRGQMMWPPPPAPVSAGLVCISRGLDSRG